MYASLFGIVVKKRLKKSKYDLKPYKNCHFFILGTRISLALYFDAEST